MAKVIRKERIGSWIIMCRYVVLTVHEELKRCIWHTQKAITYTEGCTWGTQRSAGLSVLWQLCWVLFSRSVVFILCTSKHRGWELLTNPTSMQCWRLTAGKRKCLEFLANFGVVLPWEEHLRNWGFNMHIHTFSPGKGRKARKQNGSGNFPGFSLCDVNFPTGEYANAGGILIRGEWCAISEVNILCRCYHVVPSLQFLSSYIVI